eukprot:Polyplicarium_translucidae@DN3133_c0_g1_i9.p2
MIFSSAAFLAAVATATGKFLEQHRPQFHFSPGKNWMNDPNGMVFDGTKYQLNYQYHPWGDTWGPMHWGHAESTDLIHWEHKPIAIYPDKFGTIFSGGGTHIADQTQADKSGLALGTSVLFYSQHCVYDEDKQGDIAEEDPLSLDCLSLHPPPGDLAEVYVQHQSWASTTDYKTFTKYANNPVIVADLPKYTKNIRDPKVFWHDDAWYMILANQDRNRFFKSEDLKAWSETGSFGGEGQFPTAGDAVWECPDLFKVGEDWIHIVSVNPGGNPDLKGSGSFYFMGTFDADSSGTFKPDSRWDDKETPAVWLDAGIDNYAGLVWNNLEGAPVFTGWMSNWAYGGEVPTSPWRSAMTVPRVISTVDVDGVKWVRTMPHDNIGSLRCTVSDDHSGDIDAEQEEKLEPAGCAVDSTTFLGLIDLEMTATATDVADLQITVYFQTDDAASYVSIKIDGASIEVDRSNAGNFTQEEWDHAESQVLERTRPLYNNDGKAVKLRALVDRSSIELFFDDGDLAMTMLYFTDSPGSAELRDVRIRNDHATASVAVEATAHSLKPIWDHDDMVIPEDPILPGPYLEHHRPQFHFSPAKNWMNDP